MVDRIQDVIAIISDSENMTTFVSVIALLFMVISYDVELMTHSALRRM
jgi:hypothetical protein